MIGEMCGEEGKRTLAAIVDRGICRGKEESSRNTLVTLCLVKMAPLPKAKQTGTPPSPLRVPWGDHTSHTHHPPPLTLFASSPHDTTPIQRSFCTLPPSTPVPCQVQQPPPPSPRLICTFSSFLLFGRPACLIRMFVAVEGTCQGLVSLIGRNAQRCPRGR